MHHLTRQVSQLLFLPLLSGSLALGASYNFGYVAFDLTLPANVGQFDVVNGTGANSTAAPDNTFPITNTIAFASESLTVYFKSGTSTTYGSSYFTLDPDGESLDGTAIFNVAVNPISYAVLSGTFASTSLTLNDGTTDTMSGNFSVTITDPSGTLKDGDLAVITTSPASSSSSPEPSTWFLAGVGLALLLLGRRSIRARTAVATTAIAIVAAVAFIPASASAATTVRLNTATTPGQGVSGSSQVYVAGTGFPNPIAAANITVTLSSTCGGTAVATAPALTVTQVVGTSDRIEFLIPGSITTSGTYYVTVAGTNTAGLAFSSSNCSQIAVTHTSSVLASCNPGSSMGVLAPNPVSGKTVPVTAYVPNASWYYAYATGVQAVPIEGGGTATAIATTDYINSCSTNSITGQSVCTANNNKVYFLSGTTVTTTLSTASNASLSFSGGTCENCGVAVNAVANQAVVQMGYSGATSALQFIDLSTTPPTMGTPVPTKNHVSEDILWDPINNQILSPSEYTYVYDLFNITAAGLPGPTSVAEYGTPISVSYPDSAGEDCSTRIAITVGEDTGEVYLADLNQATYTAGTPGSWTDPASAVYTLPEFASLSAGASAVAMAPGSTHLGVVAGEFGGSDIGVIQLPNTSGTSAGTPKVVDYVIATLPATPDGIAFSNGFDPHTTTAYTSPNNQKAYGLAASWGGSYYGATYVAVIDLQAMLAATRSGAHTVSPSVNLITSGIVRYVKAK